MCRLYAFRANEPTKVECSLVHAQNALMVQSREDLAGYSHGHGWGVATYETSEPHIERQAWAAYQGEHFRRAAARIYAATVVAHVRRATVGPPGIENTHPFGQGRWVLVHNGTLPNFDQVREKLLAATSAAHRAAIGGVTDSEHFFRFFLSTYQPAQPLLDALRAAARCVIGWCREIDPAKPIGLNVILTDGEQMVGTRFGRTLYHLERDGVYDCEICGFPHVHHDPRRRYRAVVVASEPISHEPWQEVPDGSVYAMGPDLGWRVEPLY
jgi:predicted glutamine amidotransferase